MTNDDATSLLKQAKYVLERLICGETPQDNVDVNNLILKIDEILGDE